MQMMPALTRRLVILCCALAAIITMSRGALALSPTPTPTPTPKPTPTPLVRGSYNCLGTATFSFSGGGQVYGFSQIIHLQVGGAGSTLVMNFPAPSGAKEVCKFHAVGAPVVAVDSTGQGTLALTINANVGDVDHDPGLNCDAVFNGLSTPTLHYLIATTAGGSRFYFTPNDDYDPAAATDSGDFIASVSGVCERSP